jgi:5'-3' exonuclease
MGIKGLYPFIRKNFPDEYKVVHLSEYSYKKIAIDISLYVYKYKSVNPRIWLSMFINLICCLRKNNVHCVFIYDTGFPEEKKVEHEKRKEQREKLKQKIFDLEQSLELYHNTGEITNTIKELAKKKGSEAYNILTEDINMIYFERELEKIRDQAVSASSGDFEKTKELFRVLDVPYFNAVTEGEATCAKLCRLGKVEASLSEDSDLIAYGSPIVLSKIDTKEETCIEVNYKKLLKKMNWNRNQFTDFCIMCGTDYNKNIPRVGCESAYKLIDKYKSIEEVEKNTNYDISILNHVRSREILRNPKTYKINIPYCGNPNYEKLEKFLIENGSNLNSDRLKKAFSTSNIVVIEDI